MAKPREIPGLEVETTYGEAAVKVVAARSRELFDHARGVLDTNDIERVHDMRVATRRLRAALELFEPCFPRKAHARALRSVKTLADGLGERRDRDVAIAALREFAEGMPAPDRRGIETLVASLRDEQFEANVALAPLVDDARLTELGAGLERLVASAKAAAPDGRG
jgi:CHAD domain-containing protein